MSDPAARVRADAAALSDALPDGAPHFIITGACDLYASALALADAYDALWTALTRYGKHDALCSVAGGYDDIPCTCGLAAALREGDET